MKVRCRLPIFWISIFWNSPFLIQIMIFKLKYRNIFRILLASSHHNGSRDEEDLRNICYKYSVNPTMKYWFSDLILSRFDHKINQLSFIIHKIPDLNSTSFWRLNCLIKNPIFSNKNHHYFALCRHFRPINFACPIEMLRKSPSKQHYRCYLCLLGRKSLSSFLSDPLVLGPVREHAEWGDHF